MNVRFLTQIIMATMMIIGLLATTPFATAGTSHNVSGYAFSYMPTESNGKNQNYNPSGGTVGQGTGWISLNCTDPGTCANTNADDYGVHIDPTSGQFSGYGWAGHFGWVNFAGASVSPSCFTAGGTHNVTGTIQYTTNGGGWNGTVFMNSQGGVTWNDPVTITCDLQAGTGTFGGHAWGNGVVGWVDFSKAVVTLNPSICTDVNGNDIPYTGNLPAECEKTTCSDSSGATYSYYVIGGTRPSACDSNQDPVCHPVSHAQESANPPDSALRCSSGTQANFTSNSNLERWTWSCNLTIPGQTTKTVSCFTDQIICKDQNANNYQGFGACTYPPCDPAVDPNCNTGGGIIPIYTEN